MGKIIKELNNKDIKLNIIAIYETRKIAKTLKLIDKKTKVIIYRCARYKKDLYRTFLILEDKNSLQICLYN
jgi:hypothetical protein